MPTRPIDRDEYEALFAELSDCHECREGNVVIVAGHHDVHGQTVLGCLDDLCSMEIGAAEIKKTGRLMTRRMIKPFTVEIRSLGEKPGKRARAKAARPQPDEAVSVAAEMPEPEIAVPAGMMLTGRVLPALDTHVPEAEQQPSEPRRRGRPRKTAAEAWVEDEARELRQNDEGRFAASIAAKAALLVLSDPEVIAEGSERIGEPSDETSELPMRVDARAVAATLLLRQGRPRLPRSTFKRGERWKARLPTAVHRAAAKRRKSSIR